MGNTRKKRSQENYEVEEDRRIPKHVLQEYNNRLMNYVRGLRHSLVVSRFSQHTWEQNKTFRGKNSRVGCLYGTPILVSRDIAVDTVLFVLEMNIDTNEIMGIGLVKNHPICGKYVVYGDNMNVNRYLYMGKSRIDRGEMTPAENEIMKFFDYVCFRGSKHMKRGNGLTRFPVDILFRCMPVCDLVKFICDLFKKNIK